MTMKRIITILATLLTSVAVFAQFAPKELVSWTSNVEALEEADTYKVVFTGKIAEGYHTYTLTDEFSATQIMDPIAVDCEIVGEPYELSTPKEEKDEFGDLAKHYYNEIIIAQNIKVTGQNPSFSGTIFTNSCTGGACKAEYYDFKVDINETATATAAKTEDSSDTKKGGSIWGLILEAILWGFAMLLTPCVFPMVPMTVSFFMKGSENVAQGRFKAAMYGLFIVLLYTVPISVIIMLTRIIGGDAVTADIFNWLSTHWIPNIIFFVVFMVWILSLLACFLF